MIKNNILLLLSLFYSFVFFFSPEVSFSQQEVTKITPENLLNIVKQGAIIEKKSIDTEGSPYFFESFRNGSFDLSNGKTSETFTMNYNIYENRIEIAEKNALIGIDIDKIREFKFTDTNDQIVFTKGYNSKGLGPEDAVQKLVEGDLTALLKYETSFHENMASYGSATQKDEYITKYTLYLNENGKTKRIRRLREKRILRALSSNRDEMEDFINENNLDLKKINHLKVLFEHYNQLLN